MVIQSFSDWSSPKCLCDWSLTPVLTHLRNVKFSSTQWEWIKVKAWILSLLFLLNLLGPSWGQSGHGHITSQTVTTKYGALRGIRLQFSTNSVKHLGKESTLCNRNQSISISNLLSPTWAIGQSHDYKLLISILMMMSPPPPSITSGLRDWVLICPSYSPESFQLNSIIHKNGTCGGRGFHFILCKNESDLSLRLSGGKSRPPRPTPSKMRFKGTRHFPSSHLLHKWFKRLLHFLPEFYFHFLLFLLSLSQCYNKGEALDENSLQKDVGIQRKRRRTKERKFFWLYIMKPRKFTAGIF